MYPVITSPWVNKFHLLQDALMKRRTDGALVRVEIVVGPGKSMADTYKELDEFITEIWKILPEYVPI